MDSGATSSDLADVLARIQEAVRIADRILQGFTPGKIASEGKAGGDPVTEADLAVDRALRQALVRDADGWLSEETADDPLRLGRQRLWVVDPIDGTKEFVAGIPEWCVSIGLVENGEPLAGGIYNRAAGHLILGAVGEGVTLNGQPVRAKTTDRLEGALVLASRSEVDRGEWERFRDAPFSLRPVGSVAYKLGLVAAGLADATWTLVPKHEWDVAAGVALVRAAGGEARMLDGQRPRFNRDPPKLRGLVASGARLYPSIADYLRIGGDAVTS